MTIGDPPQSQITYGGHCCTCSRVCHHVGGPFYCSTHQPTGSAVPITITPNITPNIWPTTTTPNTTFTPPDPGVWMTCNDDGDNVRPFGSEVEALRHAVLVHHVAVFVRWGETASEAILRAESEPEENHA